MTNKENQLLTNLVLAAEEAMEMLESQGYTAGDIHNNLEIAIRKIRNNYSLVESSVRSILIPDKKEEI